MYTLRGARTLSGRIIERKTESNIRNKKGRYTELPENDISLQYIMLMPGKSYGILQMNCHSPAALFGYCLFTCSD